MCLPPVNRVQRVTPAQQQYVKQQQQQHEQQQEQQQQQQQQEFEALPELFLKGDFQPELLLPEFLAPQAPPSPVSSGSDSPSSSGVSSAIGSPTHQQQLQQQQQPLAEVDLSWLDQDLLTSLDPMPLIEEQQTTSSALPMFVAPEQHQHQEPQPLQPLGVFDDETLRFDDDEEEKEEDVHDMDDDEEEEMDDEGQCRKGHVHDEYHIMSPASHSSGNHSEGGKAVARKTKNRKRKLACDLSADELAKTREINRIAAQRHRQAAKAKRVDRQRRFDDMGKRNELLREQVRDMSAELKTLRRLIVDMYSPNGSRHLQLMAPSAPLDFSFLGLA